MITQPNSPLTLYNKVNHDLLCHYYNRATTSIFTVRSKFNHWLGM